MRQAHEALSKRDTKLASERTEVLKRLLQEAGATLYADASRKGPQAGTSAGAGFEAKSAAPGTRVVDAEFREKK